MRLTLRLRNQTRVAAVAKEDGRKLDGGLSVDFTSAALTLDISINSLSNSLSLPALSLSFIFLLYFLDGHANYCPPLASWKPNSPNDTLTIVDPGLFG